ncbi:NUDIX hydrolase [Faecalispora anaeroviscerum]|uniref:NUDIX hydrolase n=1 Tax=Faecalispora anaeroviscerum TaxID=2991836 RepID=UPI0024BBBF62|nr:NUDIX domain-containing protein [Faecalispora anaeroviscerum]
MELLDIVDENGIPTGETVERETAHRSGIRHRTSHVWILRKRDGKVQVLLQKRSLNKDSHPGCYDISSAGHIPYGEDFSESALRELKEELGVTAAAEELVFCGCCRSEYHGVFHGQKFWDHQVSNVYILWRDMEEAEFTLQESEVDSVLWMDWDKCLTMVRQQQAPNCIRTHELEMVFSAVQLLNEGSLPPVSPIQEH